MNLKVLAILCSLNICNANCSNQTYQFSDEPIFYLYVDKVPKFNSDNSLKGFIYTNLRWPKMFDGEGKVIVSFMVSKSGRVENIKIEESLCSECDNEVIRVVNMMPDWEPGELDNRTVDVIIYLPVYFRITK